MDAAASPEAARVRHLAATGQFRRARRHCLAALRQHPDDPRLLASKASLDAHTGRTTYPEAETIVRRLVAQHPDDPRLQVVAAGLVARQKDLPRAVAELREIAAANPDDNDVRQALAGILGATASTQAEAWALYKRALEEGPLGTPCYTSAAYTLARRYQPELADQVLAGAGSVERAVAFTRSRGLRVLFVVWAVLTLVAVALCAGRQLDAGLAVAGLATLWGGWVAFTNRMVCCRQCLRFWLFLTAATWVLVVLAATGLRYWALFYLLVFAVAQLVRGRSSPGASEPAGAEGSSGRLGF